MALKGIAWSVVFLLSALIYCIIPTYLIITYWVFLNEFTFLGNPVYTYTLLFLFLYIVSLLVSVIYFAAMARAIVQRKSEDLGIPRGVKWFGAISAAIVVTFMIFWFFLTGEIAFFSMRPP